MAEAAVDGPADANAGLTAAVGAVGRQQTPSNFGDGYMTDEERR